MPGGSGEGGGAAMAATGLLKGPTVPRRWRLVLGGLLLAGLVVPFAVQSRRVYGDSSGLEVLWTWDIVEMYLRRASPRPGDLIELFAGLAPLAGLAALVLECVASARVRAAGFVAAGLLPIALLLAGSWEGMGYDDPAQVAGLAATFVMFAGAFVCLVRPDRPIGFALLGWAGLSSVALLFAPTAPDLANHGEGRTMPVMNLVHLVEVEGHPLYRVGALAWGACGIVLGVYAAAALVPRWRTAAHGRRAMWLLLGTLTLGYATPVLAAADAEFEAALLGTATLMLSLYVLRFYPCLVLASCGVADLVLLRQGPVPGAKPETPGYLMHCRAIHRAFHEARTRAMDAATFREYKVDHLRAAARDAKASGAGDRLMALLGKLKALGAVNEVEAESVASFLRGG